MAVPADTRNPALPPDLPEFSHIETERGRMTIVNNVDKAKKHVEEMENDPTTITLHYPNPTPEDPKNEFVAKLTGFIKATDAAGVEILYIKVKPEQNLVLFLLTDHPDSQQMLVDLRVEMIRHGLGHVQFQNIEDSIKEMMARCNEIMAGTVKPEPGIHPRMEYMKEEFK